MGLVLGWRILCLEGPAASGPRCCISSAGTHASQDGCLCLAREGALTETHCAGSWNLRADDRVAFSWRRYRTCGEGMGYVVVARDAPE